MYALARNKKELPLTKCTQKRDFIYVDDVVSAYLHVLAMKYEFYDYMEYGVGWGQSVPIRDFVEEVKKQTCSETILGYGSLPIKPDELLESKAYNDQLLYLGWQPLVSLEEGIRKSLPYYEIKSKECLTPL
jgi:nucleoside-diphosphate-sugar epimerase